MVLDVTIYVTPQSKKGKIILQRQSDSKNVPLSELIDDSFNDRPCRHPIFDNNFTPKK